MGDRSSREPGSWTDPGLIDSRTWDLDAPASDVIEGGGRARRAPPSIVVLVLGVAVAVGAATVILRGEPGPSTPSPSPTTVDVVALDPLPFDPADADFPQRNRPRRVHGTLSLLMGRARITLQVPTTPGWESAGSRGGWTRYGSSYLSKDTVGSGDAEAVVYWTPFAAGGWASLCPGLLRPPTDRSVAALVDALSTVPGTALVSRPGALTVDRRPAHPLRLVVRDDRGCDPGYLYTWRYVKGGPYWARTDVGDTLSVWVVPLEGGEPVVIVGETTPDAGDELAREVELLVASIRIE